MWWGHPSLCHSISLNDSTVARVLWARLAHSFIVHKLISIISSFLAEQSKWKQKSIGKRFFFCWLELSAICAAGIWKRILCMCVLDAIVLCVHMLDISTQQQSVTSRFCSMPTKMIYYIGIWYGQLWLDSRIFTDKSGPWTLHIDRRPKHCKPSIHISIKFTKNTG